MPRTASQPLKDAVASENPCAIDLWTIVLPQGTQRWTTHEKDVTLGGNTWLAAGPVIDHGPVRCTSGIEVSTLDLALRGVFTVGGVTLASLAATGAMDDVAVTYERLYLPTYAIPPSADYKVLLFQGYVVDDIEPSSTEVKLTAKSILARADEELPRRTVGPMCAWSWGSTPCGINKSLWQATDTVAAGSTTQTIVLTTGTAYAVPGAQIQFADGQQRNVTAYDSGTKTATLDSPLPAIPATGSGLTIWRGCDKRLSTCASPYANLVRFGGFPQVPERT